jgi:hypothetical protein
MNNCLLEAEVLCKIEQLDKTLEMINVEISKHLLRKSDELQIKVTQDLKDKCASHMVGPEKVYSCKVCLKVFNDGRKLGGHVSRAHKNI